MYKAAGPHNFSPMVVNSPMSPSRLVDVSFVPTQTAVNTDMVIYESVLLKYSHTFTDDFTSLSDSFSNSSIACYVIAVMLVFLTKDLSLAHTNMAAMSFSVDYLANSCNPSIS